jgi:L-iditol 2-dehydrogenase
VKQACLQEPGVIRYREIPEPEPGDRDVVIRVKRIGICGSDVHVFRGKHPLVTFPVVQGHECAGYVERVGCSVSTVRPGDVVTVQPATAPDDCEKKREGLVAQCEDMQFIGGSLPGAGSELFCVHEEYVVPLARSTDIDDAAMVEPLAVAVHAAGRVPETAGGRTVVFGAGTIGILTAQMAMLRGAAEVIVTDMNRFRLGIAEYLGIRTLAIERGARVSEEITAFLGGRKPDHCFECVGRAEPLNTAIDLVQRGGYVVAVGVYEEPPATNMLLVQDKEITIAGALMYSLQDFQKSARLVERGDVRLAPLRTHHVPFEKWVEGYRLLLESPHETLKVLVDL